MLHKPASSQGTDPVSLYKTRLGVIMFIFYALVYGGFVAVNICAPKAMENTVILGQNLAVTYGFGLIILALVMALIYNQFCSRKEKELHPADTESERK